MGDISIIARRLEGGKYVQYGWSGNGGYYSMVGARLLSWYDDPQKVEYLFGFGQMRIIGKPGSENGGESWFHTHEPDGMPHWIGKSEREIFSRIAFIDYGYFYDLDNTWYYVIPSPFRIKIPLLYINRHLDEKYDEFDEIGRIERQVAEYILGDFYESDEALQSIVCEKYSQGIDAIRKDVLSESDEGNPCYRIWDDYKAIFNYFDDWVVVKTDEDMTKITGFLVRKNQKALGAERVETIDWDV
ncbi:MAG: hypothetical protein Q4A32_09690 [Lachnospiraceae bacterium]|nr:hypothetical protein [Lachnospiraceae bacterium]